jgi:hypothetical protein
MAFEGKQIQDGTRLSGADLSAKQFYFVKLDTDGTVILPTAVGDLPYGVLQNNPASGEEAVVCLFGVTKIVADADISTPGTPIGTSADGQADAKVPGTDTAEYYCGQVIAGGGAAGAIGTAFIHGPVYLGVE